MNGPGTGTSPIVSHDIAAGSAINAGAAVNTETQTPVVVKDVGVVPSAEATAKSHERQIKDGDLLTSSGQPLTNADADNHANQSGEDQTINEDVKTVKERRYRFWASSIRVGFLIILAACSLLVCAVIDSQTHELHGLRPILWIVGIAACSLSGLIAMRTLRGISTIESELRRAAGGHGNWQNLRPIVGSGEVVEGWNELLYQASLASEANCPSRVTATLDHEAITMARAMRGLPVAWVVTDTLGQIRLLSPSACGLLGLRDEEGNSALQQAIGQDLLEILRFRTSRYDNTDPKVQQLLSDLRMVQVKQTISISNQEVRLRIVRSRLPGREGDSEGLAWALTDITQQQIATDARDQFLMTATHELRTPLNNLHAYAEALQDADAHDQDSQNEFCNIIISESLRLGRLVDQLLTVGQLEAGSMVAHRHELDILPIIQHCENQVASEATSKGVDLVMELSAKMPSVIGDRDKLEAAIVNIVGNAVKYTATGGKVTVRSQVVDKWIQLDVIDTGAGIPEEEISKVFNKFYRCSNAPEANERGNGLGLAFSMEVAKLHGGNIDVTSVLGEGSTFTLKLPVGGQSKSGV